MRCVCQRAERQIRAGKDARPEAGVIERKDSERSRHDGDRRRRAGPAIHRHRDRTVADKRIRRRDSGQLVHARPGSLRKARPR